MDPVNFIKTYAPRGSIIFINYTMSLTSHLNPSIEKHVGIYYGTLLSEHLVVESTYRKGVRKSHWIVFLKDILVQKYTC
ncbi:hypothetical protein DIBLKBHL_00088 [Camelpox virus]|nr:hypothetical protein DIBLKBHL_00088 [Camelpox virus]